MRIDTRKLRNIQRAIAKEAKTKDEISVEQIKKIAGFDLAFFGDKVVCAAIVVSLPDFKVIEKKFTITKTPMQYIPGYLAFREGPAILQTYYDLQEEPDVIMVDGHGLLHPLKCGLATYIGVELNKPTIGVARNILAGEIKEDNKVFVLNELRGLFVKTKEHANPLYVSPGNKLSINTAAEITKKCVVFPHKLPEPLHIAHKFAKKIASEKAAELGKQDAEQENTQEIQTEIITNPNIEEDFISSSDIGETGEGV